MWGGGWGGGGGGGSLPRIGYSWQNEPKILQAQLGSTSQIVSQTCMWRLNKTRGTEGGQVMM